MSHNKFRTLMREMKKIDKRVEGYYYPENNQYVVFWENYIVAKWNKAYFNVRIGIKEAIDWIRLQISRVKANVYNPISSRSFVNQIRGGWRKGIRIR